MKVGMFIVADEIINVVKLLTFMGKLIFIIQMKFYHTVIIIILL